MSMSAGRGAVALRRLLTVLVPLLFSAGAFAQSPQTPARPPVGASPENFSRPVVVPGVVGLPYAKARALLESAHLVPVLAPGTRAESATAEIAAQQPIAGTRVGPGTRIMLTVAAPKPARVTVPDVIGLRPAEAEARLRLLQLGWKLRSDGPAGAEARVAEQQPRAGTLLPAGSVIILALTQPPSQAIAVPNLVGHSLAEAESILRPLGLAMELRNPQAARPAAKIAAQAPRAGTTVGPHAAVTVIVEAIPAKPPPPPMTTVPAVVDHSLADAKRAAAGAQLHLTLPGERSVPAGEAIIVAQAPPAGRRVPVGSPLQVRLAPPFAIVPSLVGRTVRDAREVVGVAMLKLALPTATRWPEEARITWQQPLPRTKVARGSTVEIRVAPPPPQPQPSGPAGETAGGTVPQSPGVAPPLVQQPVPPVPPANEPPLAPPSPETSRPPPPFGEAPVLPPSGHRPTVPPPSGTSQSPLPVGPARGTKAPATPTTPPAQSPAGSSQPPRPVGPPSAVPSRFEQILSWLEIRPAAFPALSLLAVAALLLLSAIRRRWRRNRLRGSVRVLLVVDGGCTNMRPVADGRAGPAIGVRLIGSAPVTKLRLAA